MYSRWLLVLVLLATPAALAEVLFEAFYRIEQDNKHMGYLVQRLSQNAESESLVTYVHSALHGEATFEAIKSVAKKNSLQPLESLWRGENWGKEYTANFTGKKGWTETRNPKSRKALDKTPFELSHAPLQGSFLFYAADLTKLEKGKNYKFNYYSERLARPAFGQLTLVAENAKKVQHLVLDATGETTENFVQSNGDPIGARYPAQDTIVYWVKTRKDAVGSFEYPNSNLIALFGDLPEGKKNPWYTKAGFNAKEVVEAFPKSFGLRKLAVQEKLKITAPLPMRRK